MTIAVTRPRAQGYGALIGDDWFRMAPSQAARATVYTQDSLAKRQDNEGSAGDNVLEVGYGFSRANLTGGEGLDWWPRIVGEKGRETDAIRFWDSSNLDISRPDSGNPYHLELVKEWETFWTPTDPPVDMGASRDAFYIAESTDVHRFDDWGDNTPDDSDTLGAADVVMIDVGLDDVVIALDADGDLYIKPADSDSYLLMYEATVTGDPIISAWWRKGRVIAGRKDTANAADGELIEIAPGIGGTTGTPTTTPVVSVIDTYTGTLNDVIDAGHALVGAFSDGSLRSYVPQSDSAGDTPVLTVRAGTRVPTGETPYALGWNLGVLVFMTHATTPSSSDAIVRIYSATVLDERFDYTVGDMQLLRAWSGSVESAPSYTKNIVSSRDEIYFIVGEDTAEYSVWRLDLVTLGLFRQHDADRAAGVGLVFFDDRLAFCDGDDVILESDTVYAADGYVISPNITFGLNTPINWTNFVLEALNLQTAGTKVELYRSTNPDAILDPNHSSWIIIETYTDPAQSGVEKAAINITANQMAMMVKVYRSTNTLVSPNVKRHAVRGLPKHRDWICDVPINISDIVTAPNRMPLRVPGHGDLVHQSVISIQGKSTTLQVLDPPITFRGVVDAILEPVDYITDRGSQGQYCMVRFLGKLVGTSASSAVQGNAGTGIQLLGVATTGIGQV